jgi:hypothetical protein
LTVALARSSGPDPVCKENELEILTAPPLPVAAGAALPALEPVAYTGLEWLTDEAFREDWELNRHDRALWARY